MFGLTVEKVVIIGVIAAFLLGPERLPGIAQQLGALVRRLKTLTGSAEQRLRDELGPDFEDVDWRKLDPRQYDPRRIIREALVEDTSASPIARSSSMTRNSTETPAATAAE
ncbi:twin-arginine translocase TatA/TatE family subunit [Leifsonia flava]|uniref:Sec-independent protein translocase TatB n=1 Tax=Orlajensenia leifsoniae TaxID=2561933 RepID=A0A4Y9R6K0_9MICO|nr:twin-arginine translocase TatA/TatE family subunit [Leifsonia flava]TFV99927.1 Sec-independent protein translocase TatB [Leifsonia flava]